MLNKEELEDKNILVIILGRNLGNFWTIHYCSNRDCFNHDNMLHYS